MDEPCSWGRDLVPENPGVPVKLCEDEPTVMLRLDEDGIELFLCPFHEMALRFAGAIGVVDG